METVRLDVWLDVTCLYKTRSEAQKACRLSKVRVNGATAKPHRDLRVGDQLVLQRPLGRTQLITVAALTERHVSRAEARLLYEDHSPKPTPEEVEMRRLERIYRAVSQTPHKPDRDQRRSLRRLKRGE